MTHPTRLSAIPMITTVMGASLFITHQPISLNKGTRVAILRAGPIIHSIEVIITVSNPMHSVKPIPMQIKAD